MALTTAETRKLAELIAKAEAQDVKLAIDLIKRRQDILSRTNVMQLVRGQRVQFTGRRNVTVCGEIQKVNQKTVTVKADNGDLWRVAGSHLTAI